MDEAPVTTRQEQASTDEAATLSREQILEMTIEAHGLAVERGQAAAASPAIELLGGELHGKFKGRSIVDINACVRDMSALLGLPSLIADHSGEPGLATDLPRFERGGDSFPGGMQG